jgi:hypothetical protein
MVKQGDREKGESEEDLMRQAGLIDEEKGADLQSDLSQLRSGWGYHDSSQFRQIYEKIQHISKWN